MLQILHYMRLYCFGSIIDNALLCDVEKINLITLKINKCKTNILGT